ncbi:hypothetical protein LTR37_005424 [Vermiconidia calcicola]|uniref:Uncharacterized protein n=1 Tax=Vermiconidia calcicola TaxID=1690605 RepID=A0ACC3NM33_9PEZI|nr:hypothetical protein LTR37_005424 [Vermiconidia calcicola]
MPPFPTLPSPPTLFPTYLIPSLPFRRRHSSTDSNASSSSTASSSTTSNSPPEPSPYLNSHTSHLRCARCASDLALSTQIISKGFTGRHGRAYLVAPSSSSISPNPIGLSTAKAKNDALPNLPNTYTHKPVPRQLVTGAHTVGDISCAQCGSVLGWKYVAAEEEGQRYKVGKFILETRRVCRSATWEDCEEDVFDGVRSMSAVESSSSTRRSSGLPPNEMPSVNEVEFDSQDEDECEDLFLGVWTPQLAAKRRRQKQFAKVDE